MRAYFLLLSSLILGSVHSDEDASPSKIPLLLSPLDGEAANPPLPQKVRTLLPDDNHDNFKNVDNEYLGVESVKILPPTKTLEINKTLFEIPNDIEEDPVAFSDFFPPINLKKEIEKMKKAFSDDSHKDKNVRIVPFIVKNKTLDSSGSESQIVLRPFYPSWPIHEAPSSYEKSNKAITIMGEPRSHSPSEFNAILFANTKSPIVIVEAPNLAVIGKTAPRYRGRHPFHLLKSSPPRKKPKKRLRLLKSRFPKRRKPLFGRDVFHRGGFFRNKRRVRQFHFQPSTAYFG